MARIIENVAARMIINQRKKTLKRHAIVQIFAGMDLKANIHPMMIKAIENRSPAPRQLQKCLFKTLTIMRWPWIKERPGERT